VLFILRFTHSVQPAGRSIEMRERIPCTERDLAAFTAVVSRM